MNDWQIVDDRRRELLSREIVDHLVGVIDIKNGRAVHAIAGNRDQYAPVLGESPLFDGDAIALAKRYRAMGLSRLYVADLDALESRTPQIELLHQIFSSHLGFRTILVDVGWSGEETASARAAILAFANDYRSLRMVAATESARSLNAISTLAELIPPSRITLGLDYRGGRLISDVADEAAWIDRAIQAGVGGVLVLDLQTVGTSRGVTTTEICQRLKARHPPISILSGGGIRCKQDVQQLLQAGCESCLVATALL